jgi:ribosome maturation factor RimP
LANTHWQLAIERAVTGLAYELVDAERSAAGLLRVFIDHPLGHTDGEGQAAAIGVEDCERVTRHLQYVLEVEEVDYRRLEVSSPGLDRPLKRQADYERFAGHDISLSLKQPFQGRKNYRGRLIPGDAGWRLALDGDHAGKTLDFSLDEVREARLVPVLDFKGRRNKTSITPPVAAADDGVHGGQSR